MLRYCSDSLHYYKIIDDDRPANSSPNPNPAMYISRTHTSHGGCAHILCNLKPNVHETWLLELLKGRLHQRYLNRQFVNL